MFENAGAARGIRTPDPVITNDVLYQLSYCGLAFWRQRGGIPLAIAECKMRLSPDEKRPHARWGRSGGETSSLSPFSGPGSSGACGATYTRGLAVRLGSLWAFPGGLGSIWLLPRF